MNELIQLIEEFNVGGILIIVILICVSIKWLVEFSEWGAKRFNQWRLRKNEPEDKEKDFKERMEHIENRIEALENSDSDQFEKLNSIKEQLCHMEEWNRRQSIAICRSNLLQLYSTVKLRDPMHITVVEYETFKDLADIYLAMGGNHTMKEKVIPEIEELYRSQKNISE